MVAHDQLLVHVDFSVESGWRAAQDLLNRRPDIDAIFIASDLQAVGALRALIDLGRSPGDEVAVVGFDGIRLGEYISPRLTTVAQPFDAISTAVVDRLLTLIDGQDGDGEPSRVLSTSLVIRESCGCQPPATAGMVP
jgi:LacI family transcriptional regulator